MNDHEADRISAAVNQLRPDWPTKSIRTLLARDTLATRPRRDVMLALAYVACDSATTTPARVLEAGPWWQTVVASDGHTTTNHPPKAGQDCPHHPGQWADRCGGCLADQRAADGGDTPPRTWEPATSDAAALARAAYAQARAQLCTHGTPRTACRDCSTPAQPSAESAPTEESNHAVKQERDKAKQMLDGWQKTALQLRDQHEHEFNRAEAAEQRVTELEAAVLALADAWDDPDPERGDPDRADELRALVSDPTATDRVRREAVEAALAPIEREMEEQVDEWGTPWPWVPVIYKAITAARDAAKGMGR